MWIDAASDKIYNISSNGERGWISSYKRVAFDILITLLDNKLKKKIDIFLWLFSAYTPVADIGNV